MKKSGKMRLKAHLVTSLAAQLLTLAVTSLFWVAVRAKKRGGSA
ncbi:hypothetical protein BURKHO8Y_20135 [Burkholderia sp. 8Y]|nr:hypothetical protein BURKHO8Y_20135 [Burkholderia sp. 8Y]